MDDMDNANFSLWGTSDPERVAVSASLDEPSNIIGYVCLTARGYWIIDGDTTNKVFTTAREAAQGGIRDCFNLRPKC
jgi:hypothetical protein